MRRVFISSLIVATGVASGVFFAASPAAAGSRGGCNGTAIQSCISLSGTTLVADLYQNSAPDTSRCTAYIEIRKSNGSSAWGGPFDITSNGRRGPVESSIISLPPPSSGSYAINRVHVYTCAGNFHHTVDSVRQYYP